MRAADIIIKRVPFTEVEICFVGGGLGALMKTKHAEHCVKHGFCA